MSNETDPADHSSRNDHPGVVIRPPLLWLGLLLTGLLLDHLLAPDWGWPWLVRLIGAGLFLAGGALVLAAARQFRRAGTNVPTNRPSLTLVREGLYRRSRNPIYIGLITAYVGAAWALVSPMALLLLPVLIAVLRYGVIAREERYLRSRFAADYDAFCAVVPRWL